MSQDEADLVNAGNEVGLSNFESNTTLTNKGQIEEVHQDREETSNVNDFRERTKDLIPPQTQQREGAGNSILLRHRRSSERLHRQRRQVRIKQLRRLFSTGERSNGSSDSSPSTGSDSNESDKESSSNSESEDVERELQKDKKRKRASKLRKKLEEAKNEIRRLGKIAKVKPSDAASKSKHRSKKDFGKKKRSKKSGIQVDIGVIQKSDLIQLQPFWRKQMKKLESSIPLTVFDQGFALSDKEEYEKQHHSSSSKTSKNEGLEAPSEFKMTYGEWTENISLFKRYLVQHNQKKVVKRLNYHIKNVKQVKRSTECWMTALQYDILCRRHIFVERLEKEPIKDIGTFMKKYKDKAKDKSLTFGEANGGEVNPYAKGGKFEWKHPETGQPLNQNSTTEGHNSASGQRGSGKFQRRRRGPRSNKTFTYGFPSQGQINGNASTSNVNAPNFPNNNQSTPFTNNNGQVRGGRGTWRGVRGGIGRGTGKQTQSEA
ncbi:uncharacterized protein MELLADRAFT_106841 [Melampsora larici-populina 98AG31]|uniref:Uncharacterized protein n=1 Tax=Melampsora larici-populina (strain 98AG31 / pathotype 3-4-7) TaxID=747676 RepID=F4RMT5_MELLP|nr:uncharacterized protein MELLADRAFT_106841 [Melampsora larici-populina 98AG31]EGG06324.1 hypothetical protein MELLADRAFT_106841 [Melampsora larici-populina 98AG31]